MNWMGGNLAKFKRKNLSKKAEERQRIEEYIRRRQLTKQISDLDQEASVGSTSTNFIPAFPSRSVTSRSSTMLMQTKPTDYFKRPIDPALSANPWAGIDPNFLKPKVFPSFLKNTPRLYFDAVPGNFTVKNPEESFAHRKSSGNVILNQSIRSNRSFESGNAENAFEFGENQSDEEDEMLPQFDENEYYGPALPANFNGSFMLTPTHSRQASQFSSISSQSFASPRSVVELNFASSRANSESRSLSYVAKTRTPNIAPPRIDGLNVSHFGVSQNHNIWNFETEGVEDIIVFSPSRSFQGKEHFANLDNSHLI